MKCEICGKEILRDSQCINYKYYHNDCIENLQEENKQLQERIEYLERSNNRREDTIIEQRQEISDLEDNWIKLKEYMIKEQTRIVIENTDEDEFVYTDLLNKMQEIEQGSDSNE